VNVVSAPNSTAASKRVLAGSIAMIREGLNNFAPLMAANPIGPDPTMATVSPGVT
jgi:hypothetical protein